MKDHKVICITSSKPSTALTAGGGGGCLTLVCPTTASVFSSLRVSGDMSGKVGVSLSSLAFFPKSFSSPISVSPSTSSLAIGYGCTTKNTEDSYAMLITIRHPSIPPILHWKTRLPEGHLSAGITVSPCGHYAVGGGNSGNLYIWSTLGGNLLRLVKAHYRSVQHMTWTSGGRHLATGGADGVVHVFDLADLVEHHTADGLSVPAAIRTWSQHHLPITGLVALSDHRLASASTDGKILLLHVPSQKVMVTLQMPRKVSALLAANRTNTLYVGSANGIISMIRLDEYAMHQLSQQHGMSVQRPMQQHPSVVDTVFGHAGGSGAAVGASRTSSKDNATSNSNDSSNGIQYQTELRGHDRPISALSMLDEDNGKQLLCSGDESGCVRIWDLESASCIQVTRPWSASLSGDTTSSSKTISHPISTISVVSQSNDAEVGGSMLDPAGGRSKQQQLSVVFSLLTPLQKFRDGEFTGKVTLPAWNSHHFVGVLPHGEVTNRELLLGRFHQRRQNGNKRKRSFATNQTRAEAQATHAFDSSSSSRQEPEIEDESEKTRILELERQLKEAQNQIERWEAVNNKLMLQIKKK